MKAVNLFLLASIIGVELILGIVVAPTIFFPQNLIGEGVLSHFQSGLMMTQIFIKMGYLLIFVSVVNFLYEIYSLIKDEMKFKIKFSKFMLSLLILILSLIFVFYFTNTIIELQNFDIFKEYNLEHKEQIIFLALLKEEYALSNESLISREMNSLLSLISENDLERYKNKKLLQENAPLLNLIEYDEYLNAFGDISKSFFIIDEILQRIINFEPKQSKKIKIESVLKDQDIFELIEPSTDINDIIMPENTKELLENILKQQDKKVLERLHSWGIKSNKNIEAKIIFYGPAGTGKTMSALAMAKSMKKSVLSFDCSKILSKWVGESEQNVRKIFDTYKNIVQTCKQSPILLLNEADQFLSTRVDGSSGSDKMHNQMQNIFLEQIERFSGVIIATTNFLESLDSAFSRRFDYKIEFKKPDFKDRLKIWEKFLPKKALFEKDFDINILSNYELSGAQILMVVKNTALKVAVSKDGVFKMQDFIESIQKELNSSFDKSKIVGF